MRILIQDPVGKGYFDGINWDSELDKARDFESVAQAESFCHEQNVTRALIVVKYNDPRQDIRYSLGPRNQLLASKPATARIKSLG